MFYKSFLCSNHSKCTDTYEKIDEAAPLESLLFLSIFNLLGCTLRPRNPLLSLKGLIKLSAIFQFNIITNIDVNSNNCY
ncbi:hypothetical protein CUZ32_03160 [Streptococcus agalactiae]|nr:hypothetical protein CUZ32_03160 [Streptococcus agalactiae]